jgi:hypothetical protein
LDYYTFEEHLYETANIDEKLQSQRDGRTSMPKVPGEPLCLSNFLRKLHQRKLATGDKWHFNDFNNACFFFSVHISH